MKAIILAGGLGMLLQQSSRRVFVLLSDAECIEGLCLGRCDVCRPSSLIKSGCNYRPERAANYWVYPKRA